MDNLIHGANEILNNFAMQHELANGVIFGAVFALFISYIISQIALKQNGRNSKN